MGKQGMESYVSCPECGQQVWVVMKPYVGMLSAIAKDLTKEFGIGKTQDFEGSGKCKCGKLVVATLHVTSEEC